MANYAILKAAVQSVIATNGNNEITGAILQQTLLSIINSLGVYYQFAGIATPSTNPGTPDQNVVYIAAESGVYVNFGNIELSATEVGFLTYNGVWSKVALNIPTNDKINEIEQQLSIWGLTEFVPSYSVTDGSYINNRGAVTSWSTLHRTSNIALQRGDVLLVEADCGSNVVCPIAKVSGTSYIPQLVYVAGKHRYSFYATDDCNVVVSYYRLYSILVDREIENGLLYSLNRACHDSFNAICIYNIPRENSMGAGYINASGGVGSWSGSFYSDYLPVFPGQEIKIISPFVTDAGRCALYNAGKELVRVFDSTTVDREGNLSITIGENEYYLRCAWRNAKTPGRIIINECAAQFFRKEYGPYKTLIDQNTQAIVNIVGGDEHINYTIARDGYYINSSGQVQTLSSQGITAPIFLRKGEKITAHVRALTTVAAISITDETGSTYNPVVMGSGDTIADYVYIAGDNMYVAVSGYKTGIQITVERKGLLEQLDDKIDSVTLISTDRETQELVKTTGYYISRNGTINALSGYFYTDVIQLLLGQTIEVTSADPSGTSVARISAWSSDGATFKGVIEYGTTEITTVRYTATENVEYLRLSGSNSRIMSVFIETDTVSPKLETIINNTVISAVGKSYPSIAMFERVGCCGDSYVKGQLYGPNGLIGDRPNLAWGSVLGRLNGLNARIYASSGADTSSWQSRSDCLPLALSDDPCGLYIFCLGINDTTYVTLGTIADITGHSSYVDYPNTFYGNYGKIIEQILAHAPGCKIILMPPFLKSTSSYYNYAIGAIQEITAHYGIAMIDTAESDLAQSNFFNLGLVHAHPTSVLHSAMGKNITELVNKCIERNYDYFKTYYGV